MLECGEGYEWVPHFSDRAMGVMQFSSNLIIIYSPVGIRLFIRLGRQRHACSINATANNDAHASLPLHWVMQWGQ